MMKFINLSNHPSSKWDGSQRAAALALADVIVDYSFPQVDPAATDDQLNKVANALCADIDPVGRDYNIVVMAQGDFCLTFKVVARLLKAGIRVVAATSSRNTVDLPDGRKVVQFNFVQFRDYSL